MTAKAIYTKLYFQAAQLFDLGKVDSFLAMAQSQYPGNSDWTEQDWIDACASALNRGVANNEKFLARILLYYF